MKRQLLAGRFGPDDRFDVAAGADEQRTYLQLVAGEKSLNHGIGGALTSLKKIGVFPSEIGIDLLVLAAHVHAADTRLSRAEQSQDSWTREIRLVVPVSDSARWEAAAPTLKKSLDFLTGDRWTIGFRARPARFATIAQEALPSLIAPSFDFLSLFSGGLDSLIGAINLLEEGATPLLVSHFGEGATSDAQGKLFAGLKKHFDKSSFERLRVGMTFKKGLVERVGSENSTRGRSFLFFALGVFAGTGLGRRFILRVPENGFIALNVPLDPLRLGSNSTRTTHPYYIARWNDLLGALGIDGEIQNPYWNKTKGEMAAGCRNLALLKKLATDSLSCSSPTKGRWQGLGIEHCGYCLPCLIRRAALVAAWGIGNDATIYTVPDLRAQPLDTRESTGKQVRSFQYAIERLRGKPQLANLLIHKPGSLADEVAHLDELADVYRRGLGEVAHLIDGVEARPS
ncbi:Qat anti-phage system QueC-like protein QatC [Nitrosomonas sp. Is37]|uniref:Qat anti-phage system QueC-like protein QatC n=1 Tax=Nitrosomonas sp. Is37 TaxID=3080535 RepID=UPI00294AF199|nr:Qat anti-phage system QueC-like protein QatC [Nitrosomonas sp. Is37]MDV6344341.1 Qat anti-phage system QueC-like protein QatC [Nitrosomonas sp. Is37]